MKYDVFISYSRKDYVDEQKREIPGNEVSKIKKALSDARITYWFDENGIYSGDEFAGVIADAIDESRIFVFISSENSNNSQWTLGEIATAQEAGKKIIPVRIDFARYHKSLRVRLNALDYIDYKTNPEKGLVDLVCAIQTELENVKTTEAQKEAEERRRQEAIELQRRLQEEEKRRQERITKLEVEIGVEESRLTEFKKLVLAKEKELETAKVDRDACEKKLYRLHEQLEELKNPQAAVEARRKAEEAKRKAEEEARKAEEEARRKVAEEAIRRKEIEEARRKAAEEARRKAEEEAKRKAIEEERKRRDARERMVLKPIEKYGKYGFADERGSIVILCHWKDAKPFSEGLAQVKDSNDKWGYIDKMGKVVISCRWKLASAFSENLAAVTDENWKWGFIDKTGRVTIPCKWVSVSSFVRGVASAKDTNGKWWKIDKYGRVIGEVK